MKLNLILLLLLAGNFSSSDLYTKFAEKKTKKLVTEYFEIDTFDIINSDKELNLPASNFLMDYKLLDILTESEEVGHVFLGRAPSKTDVFDYMLLFDTDWNLVKAKVFVYREDYGGEIGSKRWLQQFYGPASPKKFKIGEDIAAISGATISVESMTRSVNHVMQYLKQ